ncbi:MAG: CapA family protein [Lachnospiraceae bacterium]|nr:CapA family protein [Lachnospiraceae bacterium]
MKKYTPWLCGAIMTLLFCGCGATSEDIPVEISQPVYLEDITITPSPTPVPTPEPTPSPTPTPFPEYDIELMMVGDNLLHMGIVHSGKQEDGSYNYDFLFEDIAPFIEAAEISLINQETILGGNDMGFSGYPKFNSPTEVGDAIVKAGFDVVLFATNHAADKDLAGITNCLDFWEQNYPDTIVTGIQKEAEEENEIHIIEIDGIRFAFLNYTYGPNMETVPKDIRGKLDLLCAMDEKGRLDFTSINPQVLEDIKRADELADYVIVCPHWGAEYTKNPTTYQKNFAMEMTAAGADIIIGTHPHVVQPIEWIEAENGNKSLCYYSLGNYVSTQKGPFSMLEGMAWISIHVTEDGHYISEERTGVIPLVNQYKASPVRFEGIYLLEEYTEELAAKHGIIKYGEVPFSVADVADPSAEIFGDWVLTREDVLGE